MIHEATFENGKEDKAIANKHSTTDQAVNIANQAKVWRTVLTHFSVQPATHMLANLESRYTRNKIMVAMEHMQVRLSDFKWLYRMYPVYRELNVL
jgi:ribonuclease Z